MADFVPEHVIVKIFERLPIKSLIRFTCLSKRWKFIILSDPQFAKSQYQLACQQQTLSRRIINYSPFKSELYSDVNRPSSLRRELQWPFEQSNFRFNLLCSCRGLVLASVDQKYIFIWNPVTGFFKPLPQPDQFAFPVCIENHILSFYGFGYLSATDDYKVLIGSLIDDDDDGGGGGGNGDEKEKKKLKDAVYVHIFSTKANIWKGIEAPFSGYYMFPKGTLSNEALHWLNNTDEFDTAPDIHVFDLAKEEFRTMPLPDHDYGEGYFRKIGVFGGDQGRLCVFCGDLYNSPIDIWVMREYGVADSWSSAREEEKLETYIAGNPFDDTLAYEEALLSLAAP